MVGCRVGLEPDSPTSVSPTDALEAEGGNCVSRGTSSLCQSMGKLCPRRGKGVSKASGWLVAVAGLSPGTLVAHRLVLIRDTLCCLLWEVMCRGRQREGRCGRTAAPLHREPGAPARAGSGFCPSEAVSSWPLASRSGRAAVSRGAG